MSTTFFNFIVQNFDVSVHVAAGSASSPSKISLEMALKREEAKRAVVDKIDIFKMMLADGTEIDRTFGIMCTGKTMVVKEPLKNATRSNFTLHGVPLGQVAGGMPPRFVSEAYHVITNREYRGETSPTLEAFKAFVRKEVSGLCNVSLCGL